MEVKNLNPTAVATFKVKPKRGDEQAVSFTVRLLGIHEIPDYVPTPGPGVKFRQSKVITEALIDTVSGWDITCDGGQPVECNEENKRKFLPYLLGLRVIKGDEEPGAKLSMDNILGMALLEFAGDSENFLKN
jgi:hypothetical protein